jgi:hypothetical protein
MTRRCRSALPWGLMSVLLACGNEAGPSKSPALGTGGSDTSSGGSKAAMSGGNPSTAGATAEPSGGGGGSSSGAASAGSANGGGGGLASSAGMGGGGSGPTGPELLRATFDAATPGPYAEEAVEADFNGEPTWNDGLDEGRASIVEEDDQRFLRVTYPANQFGPGNGGVQFKVPLGGSHEELFFAYRVRFAAGFSFVKGGKLPGLVGGSSPTGCNPDPDGFSARNMWRGGGSIVQYVYWPEQPSTCGDDLDYEAGGDALSFTPGQWHTVEHRVRMNAVGSRDGVLEGWVDGELCLSDDARLWRNDGSFAIDTLYFSTFFGGGDSSWAPASAQTVDFDDLVVSTEPISH